MKKKLSSDRYMTRLTLALVLQQHDIFVLDCGKVLTLKRKAHDVQKYLSRFNKITTSASLKSKLCGDVGS